MKHISIVQNIAAPADLVFQTISDIRNFSKAIPHIVETEILSETASGAGVRFRETRLMNGKEATTELEITEYVQNERIRIVADTHGTVWDTLYTLRHNEGNTELTLTMEAKAYKFLPRLINPLIMGMVGKAVAKDMEFVKEYCEK